MLNQNFGKIFRKPKPILGMIHLAGDSYPNKVERAVSEIRLFDECGIDGAIVENYHTKSIKVMELVLAEASKLNLGIALGVNVLPNEFHISMPMAAKYNAQFVQLDVIAGKYTGYELDFPAYEKVKAKYPDIVVLGGVWPKYYFQTEGSSLEADLAEGAERCEAIVVTGEGTGMETPLDKIKKSRKILGKEKPLIVGAGLTPGNAYEQLMIADGAIVGSYLKTDGETYMPVQKSRIESLMSVVNKFRK